MIYGYMGRDKEDVLKRAFTLGLLGLVLFFFNSAENRKPLKINVSSRQNIGRNKNSSSKGSGEIEMQNGKSPRTYPSRNF